MDEPPIGITVSTRPVGGNVGEVPISLSQVSEVITEITFRSTVLSALDVPLTVDVQVVQIQITTSGVGDLTVGDSRVDWFEHRVLRVVPTRFVSFITGLAGSAMLMAQVHRPVQSLVFVGGGI